MNEENLNKNVNENVDEDLNKNPDEKADDNLDENPDENSQEKNENKDINKKENSETEYDYSEIKLPEGIELDKSLLDEFNPLAQKLNLSNESANEFVKLAVKLSTKNAESFKNAVEQAMIAEKNSYLQLLNDDKELNANNTEQYDQYLNVSIEGLNAVATDGFKQFIKDKGLTHHPEFIKTFHKIGQLCKDADIPNVKFPAGVKQDAADVLYGSKE